MTAKTKILHIAGVVGLTLLLIGASLYAINSPQRMLVQWTLAVGALMMLGYVTFNLRLIISFFEKRSSRYGANTVVMIVLFATILVVIQALSTRHNRTFDLTRNKRFTLADQTLGVLANLEKDVDVFAFYQRGAPERFFADGLLGQFAQRSDRFRFELIDPDQRPQRAKDMEIKSYGTTVVQCAGKKELVTKLNEESLLNAIVKVTRDLVKTVCFVYGHGEKDPMDNDPDGYAIARQAIEKENYNVKSVSLFEDATVPDDCDVIVVAGPRNDYFESETDKIGEHLAKGRNAVFLLDPQVNIPNIETLLAQYGIEIDDNLIVDPFSRVFGGDYTVPVVAEYENHLITWEFDVATFFPTARSVRIKEGDIEGLTIQYLAKTGKSAWGETDLDGVKKGQAVRDDKDVQAPVPIALIAVKRFENGIPNAAGADLGRVVVFGDSDFADNGSFRVSGNADLFLNVINFLAEERDRIAIRAKEGLGDRVFLTVSQGRFVFLVSVILLPLAVIGFGTSVFVRKRRQA
ncbi:MAG: GldG family protein [Candidatus Latescibacterota bacterium]|nr:MAG: GldG family protein [Candidatus Latescibacterota bacterium]